MNDEWKIRPYLGVLPLVFRALRKRNTNNKHTSKERQRHGERDGVGEMGRRKKKKVLVRGRKIYTPVSS